VLVPLRPKECDVLAYVLVHRDRGVCGAVWAPVAHEDHERRAVLAAIELRQRLQEAAACSAQPQDKRVRLRMGLPTGSLVVGPLPSPPQQLYTALGATTTLATVLRQRAHPEAMLLSAAPTARPHPMVRSLMCCGSIVDCWSAPHRRQSPCGAQLWGALHTGLGLSPPATGCRYSPHHLAMGGSGRGGSQAGGVGRETVQRDIRPAGYRSGYRHRWQPVAALSGKGSSRDR
jgi:hypothetical protein